MKKLQPFNLDVALAGAKVVTGAGFPVTGLTVKRSAFASKWPVKGTVRRPNGTTQELSWTKNGYWLSSPNSPEDLFMAKEEKAATKKIVYWVNFYERGSAYGYPTRMEANQASDPSRIGKARKVALEVAE